MLSDLATSSLWHSVAKSLSNLTLGVKAICNVNVILELFLHLEFLMLSCLHILKAYLSDLYKLFSSYASILEKNQVVYFSLLAFSVSLDF